MARPPSDDPLDRLLTRALSSRASAGDVCPEPELLAAFVDGSLEPAERAQVERHAASCSKCAHMLAATVASAPAFEVPAQRSLWSGWRAWRWAIPAATAVTVVGVWFASSRPRDLPAPTAVEDRAASSAAPPAVAQVPPSSAAAPKQDSKATDSRRESYTPQIEALAKKERDIAEREVAAPQTTAPLEARADSQERLAAEASKPAALADAAPSSRQAQQPASPPPARNVEQAAPQGAAAATATSRLMRAEAIPLTVSTPNPAVQWRIRDRIIERSTDRGATWTVEYTAPQPIAGGTAPSLDVAWFFSPGGLVVRRTSAGWVQTTAPPGVQILSIEASSAAQATIRVADGRTFETKDGGATWNQR